MRPFRGNRWSSQISVFIPVCVQWSSHTLQRRLRKDKKEQGFSSWVCPSIWKRRELGKGVFGQRDPTSPWKRREWLGAGLYNGQAGMGHPQPGHGAGTGEFQHGWLHRPAPARRGQQPFQPFHSFSLGKRSGSATAAKAGSSGWWLTGRFMMSASFPRGIPGAAGLSATMPGRMPR